MYTQSVDACTGIKEMNQHGVRLKLFPNPTNGQLFLETDKITGVAIYDMLGRLILFSTLNTGLNQLDITGWTKGIYFVKAGPEARDGWIKLVIN
jgi:hypothetical protein